MHVSCVRRKGSVEGMETCPRLQGWYAVQGKKEFPLLGLEGSGLAGGGG